MQESEQEVMKVTKKICQVCPVPLTLCMLGKFACFFGHLWILYKNQPFSKESSRNTIRVPNSLDPDQAQPFVGPDLGPNSLQRLSADNNSGESVKTGFIVDAQPSPLILIQLTVGLRRGSPTHQWMDTENIQT